MNTLKLSYRLIILIISVVSFFSCGSDDVALRELDNLIELHPASQARYQRQLDSLRSVISLSDMTVSERFNRYGQLFDLYRGFNIDSQLVYVQERLTLAALTGVPEHMQAAQLNNAEVLMRSGM